MKPLVPDQNGASEHAPGAAKAERSVARKLLACLQPEGCDTAAGARTPAPQAPSKPTHVQSAAQPTDPSAAGTSGLGVATRSRSTKEAPASPKKVSPV